MLHAWKGNTCRVFVGESEFKKRQEDTDIDGRIICASERK